MWHIYYQTEHAYSCHIAMKTEKEAKTSICTSLSTGIIVKHRSNDEKYEILCVQINLITEIHLDLMKILNYRNFD